MYLCLELMFYRNDYSLNNLFLAFVVACVYNHEKYDETVVEVEITFHVFVLNENVDY
jgi:hypothetical protein